MTIFTNVRKSIDYKVFILLNVHPAGKDQIEPYNMKINSLQRFYHPQFRGVRDIPFFIFRLAKIFA